MKTSLKTKLLITGNVIAVVVIAAIILLHNFQDSDPVEKEVLSFNQNTERASFHPMTDLKELDTDAFASLFEEEDDKDKDKEKEDKNETTVEEDTDEADKNESDETEMYAAEQETSTQDETANQSNVDTKSSNTSSQKQQSSSETSGGNSGTGGDSGGSSKSNRDSSTSNSSSTEEVEETPQECNLYQVRSNGKCVDKNYVSIVQAKLSSPFSAEGGNPITIKYDGVEFGKISPGQVVEDGKDIKKGAISSLGGINYTEDRKEKLRAQLSGLIH